MSLVRYGTNVFELDDVYGLDLYESDDTHELRVVLRGGEESFKMRFDARSDAERAFETLCQELEVRELTPTRSAETPGVQ
ncbi:MAG: hypothetical protein ABEN55_01995 [Bradymonadaceae bacterium]